MNAYRTALVTGASSGTGAAVARRRGRLEAWPSADHRTRMVFVTRDLPKTSVDELLAALEERSGGASDPVPAATVASPARPTADRPAHLTHSSSPPIRRITLSNGDGEPGACPGDRLDSTVTMDKNSGGRSPNRGETRPEETP